jgi:hypothetical protein
MVNMNVMGLPTTRYSATTNIVEGGQAYIQRKFIALFNDMDKVVAGGASISVLSTVDPNTIKWLNRLREYVGTQGFYLFESKLVRKLAFHFRGTLLKNIRAGGRTVGKSFRSLSQNTINLKGNNKFFYHKGAFLGGKGTDFTSAGVFFIKNISKVYIRIMVMSYPSSRFIYVPLVQHTGVKQNTHKKKVKIPSDIAKTLVPSNNTGWRIPPRPYFTDVANSIYISTRQKQIINEEVKKEVIKVMRVTPTL